MGLVMVITMISITKVLEHTNNGSFMVMILFVTIFWGRTIHKSQLFWNT